MIPTFEEIYATLPGNGWLSEDEARLLYSAAQETEGAILEVGCYQGRSSVLLASFGRLLFCVDPFDRGDTAGEDGGIVEAAWRRNVAYPHVILFKVPIEEWGTRPVGFAYLDGDHSYQGTLDQIEKALECRANVIAIHDVNDSGGGLEVKRAAVETLGDWDERVERLAVWRRK